MTIGHNALSNRFWDAVRRLRPGAVDLGTTKPPPPASLEAALVELDAIRDDCRRLVKRRATLSAATAIVPVPGLDVGADVAILVKLLPRINERFGLTPAQLEGLDADTRRVVLVLIGSMGSTLVGRLVSRELIVKVLMKLGVRVTTKGVVKFVPLIGQAVSATISFGAMKLVGDRHIDDCYEIARRALLEKAGGASKGDWEIVP